MTVEEDLSADIAALRGELLAWILTEVRGGRTVAAPLADDLVEVVRRGLQRAVDDALRDFDEARTAAISRALTPKFENLLTELTRSLGEMQLSVETDLNQASDRTVGLFAHLENRLAQAVAATRDPPPRGVVEDLSVVEAARTRPQSPAPLKTSEVEAGRTHSGGDKAGFLGDVVAVGAVGWAAAGLAIAVALGLGATGGWFLRGDTASRLVPETGVIQDAQKIETELNNLAPAGTGVATAPPPRLDAQAVAHELAPVARAIAEAGKAPDTATLRRAHEDALVAIGQLKDALAGAASPREAPAPAAPHGQPARRRP